LSAQRNFIDRQNQKLQEQNNNIEKVNALLAQRVKEIFDRNKLLEQHWRTLLAISKSRSINFGDFEEAIKHIIKTAAESLKSHRVSVWCFNTDRNSLQCLMLYDWDRNQFSKEEELLATDFPRYFEALRDEEIIPADYAEKDSQTFEFKDSYLRQHDIVSMMDSPFFLDGKLGGVLCCEHRKHRHWISEDIIFAQALSDLITLIFKSQQRRAYERKIRHQRKEISKINQSLEARVSERTQVLEQKNHQLSEYAFINSHLLRAPLCRILGLINLFEYAEISEKRLVEHLKLSGEELDAVVKKINAAIDEGTTLDRTQFDTFGEKTNEDF
jgi:GAF domain-containing protein